jgi:hypothetical protein
MLDASLPIVRGEQSIGIGQSRTPDDTFADAYSADNETALYNAHYNRPEMLRLAGDVSGSRILDAGCGSGPLSAALRAKGAVVTASTRARPWSTWPTRDS